MSLAVLDGAEHKHPAPPLLDPSSVAPTYGTGSGVQIGRYGTGVVYTRLNGTDTLRWTIPVAKRDPECWFGFAVYMTILGGNAPIAVLFGDGAAVPHLSLYLATDGSLSLYRGTSAGTLLETSATGLMAINTWYYIEVYGLIDNATGAYEIRINGTNVLDGSGVDSRNGGTDANVSCVGVTRIDNATFSGAITLYDDIYAVTGDGVDATGFQDEISIEKISPTGAGNYTQLTPSAGSNWQNVDEIPFSASDYNGSPTPGQKDTYAMSNLAAASGDILGAVLHTATFKNNAGFIKGRRLLRISSTDYAGADYPSFSATMQPHSEVLEESPATTAAWTISEINAIETGFEVRSA